MVAEFFVNFLQLCNEWNMVCAAWEIYDSQIQGRWIPENVPAWFRTGYLCRLSNQIRVNDFISTAPKVIPLFFSNLKICEYLQYLIDLLKVKWFIEFSKIYSGKTQLMVKKIFSSNNCFKQRKGVYFTLSQAKINGWEKKTVEAVTFN